MRSLYQFIIRIHPPAFRRRFGEEMTCIFDESARADSLRLLVDGLFSLLRQWILRTDSWKLGIALCVGVIQVFGFGIPFKGHQRWVENHQELSPPLQAMMLFALIVICGVFILIAFLSVWNSQFQRRRSVTQRRSRATVRPSYLSRR